MAVYIKHQFQCQNVDGGGGVLFVCDAMKAATITIKKKNKKNLTTPLI